MDLSSGKADGWTSKICKEKHTRYRETLLP
jgi:hypothetical protein